MDSYRISFGNGQVSEEIHTYKLAKEQYYLQVKYDPCNKHLRIERYEGCGEWFPLPGKKGRPLLTVDSEEV